MNSRNLDEMIERYKKEMLTYSRRAVREQSAEQSEQPVMKKAEPRTPSEDCADDRAVEPEQTESAAGSEDSSSGLRMLDGLLESCAGTVDSQSQTSVQNCRDLKAFMSRNTSKGSLIVEVNAYDTEFTVAGARVIVMIPLNSGNVIVFNGVTEQDGQTVSFELPAPPKEYSLTAEGKPAVTFAAYTVLVEHPEYARSLFSNVPVFSGVRSIQPVRLFKRINDSDIGSRIEIPDPILE